MFIICFRIIHQSIRFGAP